MLQFEGLFLASRDQDQVKKLNLNQKVKKKKKATVKGYSHTELTLLKVHKSFGKQKERDKSVYVAVLKLL